MITNPNYIPPKTPYDAVPEGYCAECESFTTDYNARGECRVHGISLVNDPADVGPICSCGKPELYCVCP